MEFDSGATAAVGFGDGDGRVESQVREEWEMLAAFVWVHPKGYRQKIPARFYFRRRPTTEKVIERIVNFQEGYTAEPAEVEVWPAQRVV